MIKYALLFIFIYIFLTSFVNADEYILKKGDSVSISVWGEENLTQEAIIDDNGMISYPLIGEVQGEGLTPQQLDDKITELLKADYFVNPEVTVAIARQQFFITGEVKSPGVHELRGNIGPLQAVTLAGGFTDFASPNIRIIRQTGGKEEAIKVNVHDITDKDKRIKEKYIIKPNDVIVVPRSFF